MWAIYTATGSWENIDEARLLWDDLCVSLWTLAWGILACRLGLALCCFGNVKGQVWIQEKSESMKKRVQNRLENRFIQLKTLGYQIYSKVRLIYAWQIILVCSQLYGWVIIRRMLIVLNTELLCKHVVKELQPKYFYKLGRHHYAMDSISNAPKCQLVIVLIKWHCLSLKSSYPCPKLHNALHKNTANPYKLAFCLCLSFKF